MAPVGRGTKDIEVRNGAQPRTHTHTQLCDKFLEEAAENNRALAVVSDTFQLVKQTYFFSCILALHQLGFRDCVFLEYNAARRQVAYQVICQRQMLDDDR